MQSQFLNASKTHSQLTKSSGTRKASDDAPQGLPLIFLGTQMSLSTIWRQEATSVSTSRPGHQHFTYKATLHL